MTRYAVVTFGCRVNQADSQRIHEELRADGAAEAHPDRADVIIVNTCSVTASADQGARQTIRRISRANPGARIVTTGCYATRCADELSALPNVVRVIPNTEKPFLAQLLRDQPTMGERSADGAGACGAVLSPGDTGRTALTLAVQTGCEERCSYCIIPSTRGRSRSLSLSAILQDVRRAVDAGYKEIVITGVHLGSYGRDFGEGIGLVDLVRALAAWKDDVLFRLSSIEPMDCTPAIIDLVAGSERLAPHFHLPLQHGADDVLTAMQRPYTVAYYEALVERIRRLIPDAAIGSDIIVGFPGETNAHFNTMCTLLEKLPLTHLHVFPYSDRPGTAAARLSGKVEGNLVRRRGSDVRAIGTELAARFRRSQVGKVRRALTVDDGTVAVTDNYLRTAVSGHHGRNEWVSVRL